MENPERFRDCDPWMLARRIPDFLHQLVNQGDTVPTGMLEVQTPPHETIPVQWVQFDSPPDPEDAFGMLPPTTPVRAVITGTLTMDHEGIGIEIVVHNREDLDTHIATKVQVSASMEDPTAALCRLAQHLARLLELEYQDPPAILLTNSGPAFFRFLAGLDGSALLSGDLEIEVREDAEILLRPYKDALGLDPEFGRALRAAHLTLFTALEDSRIGANTCCELIDSLLSALPVDGEACVQVADQLTGLGEDSRARAWLEHASHLTPPPPKSLENLGILCANNGDTIEARNLWLDGLDLNGHPDFLAHLARLSFSEGQLDDAWDQVLRGLRRIYERRVRAEEWGDEGHDLGLLLRYLVDHLGVHKAPEDVSEALLDLRGLLSLPEDHVDLGKCLLQLGYRDESREEINRGLGEDLSPTYRDDGIRVLLSLDVADFDRRFATASDEMATAVDPGAALAEMETFLEAQPEFWPALYLKSMGCKRLNMEDEALDCLAEVLVMCPGQPDALLEMAELFDTRGNPKRALECVEEAIESRPDDAQLYAAMARYFLALDRSAEARAAIENARDLAPDDRDIQRLAELL